MSAPFPEIHDLLFEKISSISQSTASARRALDAINTAAQLQAFLDMYNRTEADFDAVEWIHIQLGLLTVPGMNTPNPTQINLNPIFLPSTIQESFYRVNTYAVPSFKLNTSLELTHIVPVK